eukprot:364374-Chlamydomonas_euryale.AAC.9
MPAGDATLSPTGRSPWFQLIRARRPRRRKRSPCPGTARSHGPGRISQVRGNEGVAMEGNHALLSQCGPSAITAAVIAASLQPPTR